jgi:hypothetical protein
MPFVRSWRSAVVCLAETFASIRTFFFFGMTGLLLAGVPLGAQNAQPTAPNSDPTYQALRNSLDLKRDAGTFICVRARCALRHLCKEK